MNTRHRGVFWTAVVLAAAVLVTGTLLAVRSWVRNSGPDGAVKGYFAALQQADAPKALSFGSLPAGSPMYLTSNVLRVQQEIAPITDIRIESVHHAGGQATVVVDYTLGFSNGAQQVRDTVHVRHSGRSWRLVGTAAATRFVLPQAEHRAAILASAVPTGTTLLFPGAVPISFDTPLFQLAASTDSLALSSPASTTLTVQVSAAGRTQVLAAVTAALRTCLTAGTKADPTCPLPSDRYVPGSLIGQFPESALASLTLSVDNDPNGVIEIEAADIPVTGHYSILDFENQPQAKSGLLTLPLTALIYPTEPLTVEWSGTNS